MELRNRRACREPFHLPLAEDRAAIQQAIAEVLQNIAANEIDTRRASLLLRGLRIATLNLPKEIPNPNPDPLVDEIVLDPAYGLLAPEAELGTTKHKSSATLMLEKLQRQFGEDIGLPGWVRPSIQAAESPLNPHPIKTLRKNRGRRSAALRHLQRTFNQPAKRG